MSLFQKLQKCQRLQINYPNTAEETPRTNYIPKHVCNSKGKLRNLHQNVNL